jgi:hypothetical protein
LTAREHSLLHDDALVVRVEHALGVVAAPWLPLHAMPPRDATVRIATIDIVTAAPSEEHGAAGAHEPLLHFDGVRAFARDDLAELHGASRVRGEVALGARHATIRVVAHDEPHAAGDVYSMLTLASAFLLGRSGAALVHAGGVVDPEGRAWLLVGDTHAGKTTTCVSLVAAGWRYLADDQVVLRFGDTGDVEVEGWPRRAHLDEGWSDGVVTRTRGVVDLRARWGERWLARAPLGGVLLPTVRAEEATRAETVDGATAFTALVRQSPWLLADRGAAAAGMALLRAAASRTTRALTLGRDSYARGEVLAERLSLVRD